MRKLKDENGKEYVPFPSEYEHKESLPEFHAESVLGHMGACLGSKSIYRYENEKNLIVFNSNVLTKENGKIWHGDLDLTVSHEALKALAEKLGTKVYVLYESDARFENEKDPKFDNAVMTFTATDMEIPTKIGRDFSYIDGNGIPRTLSDEEYRAKYPPTPRAAIVEDESRFNPIELPDLSTIKVTKKSDPLSQFQKYFIDKFGKEDATKVYRNLYVTKSYMEGLEELATKYAKKAHPHLHPVKIEQSVAMYLLDMSPCNFQDEQPWEKPNTGYVRREDSSSF